MITGAPHRIDGRVRLFFFLLGLNFFNGADLALPQTVSSKQEIARVLLIDKLSVQDGSVSGEIYNRSLHAVRDVQLFVRHAWLWDDERHPGKDDPGRSEYRTLTQTIAPGETVRFTFAPSSPLPKLSSGHFETSVSIAGFTEIIPWTK